MIEKFRMGFVETPFEIAELMVSLSDISKEKLILDPGCGKGVFLETLRKIGYINCVGIEIDPLLYKFCKEKFKEFKIIKGDYLDYSFKEKFDLIIGNPPYVHFNQLPINLANKVKSYIKTGEGDIYYAFIIKSIHLLKKGGQLIFITPYHFFYNTYAKIVRETILNFGKIEIIIDLDEVKLFKNENPETIIFKFIKGNFNHREEKIKLLSIKKKNAKPNEIKINALNALKSQQSNEVFEFIKISHYIDTQPWSTFFIKTNNFPYIPLKNIAKVGVGLVSGFDKAFLVDDNFFLKLGDEEKKFIKEFVKAKNCERFIVRGSVKYILIDDRIKDEKLLPLNIYNKLIKYKEEMEKRYLPQDKKWFNWLALRNYEFLIKNY
jgi:adenine-specific DNA-methyltransferase